MLIAHAGLAVLSVCASVQYEPPSVTDPMLPRPTSAAASASGAAVFTSGASSDVRSREEELARREEALRIREANAAQAQEDALKYGIKKKNWPICCPITHHDIAGEIPDGSKFNVRVAYGLFYGMSRAAVCVGAMAWLTMGYMNL